MRICQECETTISNGNKSGLCKKHLIKKWHKDNKGRVRELWESHMQKTEAKLKRKQRDHNRYIDNIDKRQHINREYYKDNKEDIIAKKLIYHKNRLKTDPNFKLRCTIRRRLNNVKKGLAKTCKYEDMFGCTFTELRIYIESKFQPGMSWCNHNRNGWHIDHIEPLCRFDLTDPEQLKEACHYTNLQPLWAEDHKVKTIEDNKINSKVARDENTKSKDS